MILEHVLFYSYYIFIFLFFIGVFRCIDQIFNWNHLKDTFLVYLFWVLRISFSTSKSSRNIGHTNSWTVCFLIHSFEVHKLETMGKTTTAKRKSIGNDAKYVELVFFELWNTHHIFCNQESKHATATAHPKKTRCHLLDKTNLQIYLKNRWFV